MTDFTKDCLKFELEEAEWLLNEPESLSHLLENQFLMWRVNGPSAPHLLSQSPVEHESRE